MDPDRQTSMILSAEDREGRQKVEQALLALWDALELSTSANGIRLSKTAARTCDIWESRYLLYKHTGEQLLGEGNCPEREVFC